MTPTQGDLFGHRPVAYPNGPGWTEPTTSRAAAVSMRPHVSKQQQKILTFLRERGAQGGTYLEIVAGTSLGAPSVCGRMVELVEAKVVVISKTTRPTPSGRQARVYIAVGGA